MDAARKEIRSIKAESFRRRRSSAIPQDDLSVSLLQSIEEGIEDARSNTNSPSASLNQSHESIARLAAEAVAEVDATPSTAQSSRRASLDRTSPAKRDGRQLWSIARRNLVANMNLQTLSSPPNEVEEDHGANGNGSFNDGRRSPFTASFNAASQFKRQNSIRVKSISQKNIVEKFLNAMAPGNLALEGAIIADEELEQPGMFAFKSDARVIKNMLIKNYLNILLLCVPFGIIAGIYAWSPSIIFFMNFIALIPMALLLGEVTEDLAVRFGDTVGGLLNATFGNVVEMILSIAALQKGLYTVVAASLLGSILSNLLLVLGMCFLFGGMKYKEQHFSSMANKVSCSLLFLACAAIIIPTNARVVYGPDVITDHTLTELSHATAVLLILVYGGYLFFQLKTHADAFAGEENDEVCALSLSGSIAMLTVITGFVAVCSEYLTGAIEAVSESTGMNQAFLGLIVLPIAGNAAEHITAVFVAVKNKMDLAIGVSLGSSIQIAIFVIPFTVIAGWVMGRDFTLNFDPFAVLMLTVSVILAYFVSSDGHSNWLLGVQLISTYVLIGFVFLMETEHGGSNPPGMDGLSAGDSARKFMLR